MSLFSVVIPVFNKEAHAERCLKSVLGQTLQDIEVIVVDDSSRDRSIDRMRRIADGRVKFFSRSEPGPGGYAARNYGISQSSSRWVAFLDADDTWKPNHLASMAELVGERPNDVGCIFTGYEMVEPQGFCLRSWFLEAGRVAGRRSSEEMLEEWLLGGCPMWTGGVAIDRTLLQATGGFPAGRCRRGGDRDLWLRTICRTNCVYTGLATAVYHKDAENMLTRSESFSARLCLQDSIEAELTRAGPGRQALLKRIYNREVYKYAVSAWKARQPISDNLVRGYFASMDPMRFALMLAMRRVPMPLPASVRSWVRARRAQGRKEKRGY